MLGESSSAELSSRETEGEIFLSALKGGNEHGSKHGINDGKIK